MIKVKKDTNEMYANGIVGGFENGFDAHEFSNAVDEFAGEDFTLHITSDGGDVFEGIAIVNQIRSYAGQVNVVINSLAASIASVIAAAGDSVKIHDGSFMMIHNPWTVAMGDSNEFRFVADLLDKIATEVANVYASRSGTEASVFLDMMQKDTYLNASESLEIGLVDEIIFPAKKPKAEMKPVAFACAFPAYVARNHRLREARLSRK